MRIFTGVLLFILMLIVNIYLNYQIKLPNMNYYYGKDNGVIVQVISVIIFSFLFFLALCKTKKLYFEIEGIFIGIFTAIICYISLYPSTLFAVVASTLSIIIFVVQEYLFKYIKTINH